jgi:hypothetical protein
MENRLEAPEAVPAVPFHDGGEYVIPDCIRAE